MKTKIFSKLHIIIYIILSFFFVKNSVADIWGKTEYIHLRNGVAGQHVPILNCSLHGSFVDAFITGLKLAESIQSIIDGNVISGGISAYQEARELQRQLGDKMASENYVIGFDRNQGEKVELIFTIDSDDDPFGYIISALPQAVNSSIYKVGFSKELDEHWTKSNNIKHSSKKVTIDLETVEPGNYVVMFCTKETDCSTCFSIVHAIGINIREPVHNYPQQFRCDNIILKNIQEIENELNGNADIRRLKESRNQKENFLKETQQLKENLVLNSSSHRKMETLKTRRIACKHAHDPNAHYATEDQRRAAVNANYDCEQNAVTELQGVCPEIIWGCDNQATCDEFIRLSNLISSTITDINSIEGQLLTLELPYREKIKNWLKGCIKKQEN